MFPAAVKIDPATIESDIENGTLRQELETELTVGFRLIRDSGDAVPLPSYYAAKIATIVNDQLPDGLPKDMAFYLYQEILLACEAARATVLGEQPGAPS